MIDRLCWSEERQEHENHKSCSQKERHRTNTSLVNSYNKRRCQQLMVAVIFQQGGQTLLRLFITRVMEFFSCAKKTATVPEQLFSSYLEQDVKKTHLLYRGLTDMKRSWFIEARHDISNGVSNSANWLVSRFKWSVSVWLVKHYKPFWWQRPLKHCIVQEGQGRFRWNSAASRVQIPHIFLFRSGLGPTNIGDNIEVLQLKAASFNV